MPALFWLSSYVASHCFAVAQQSGAKEQFYCTVYYITLNSNCESERLSKHFLTRLIHDKQKRTIWKCLLHLVVLLSNGTAFF